MWNSKKKFCFLLKSIASKEEQIQSLRRHLNQEPLFNIKDLYNNLASEGTINSYDIQMFSKKKQSDIPSIESMIKMYNNNDSMILNQENLAKIFTSRKNHIIARLVLERPAYGLLEPEIRELCRKILHLQISIHQQIVIFRSTYDIEHIAHNLNNQIYVDMPKLQQMLSTFNIQINIQSLIQYINAGSKSYSILTHKFIQFLSQNNCKIIKQFLTQTLPPKNSNPLIDDRFQNLLPSPKTINCFNHRQKRSIEDHLVRINCKRREEVYIKLDKYRKLIEDQVMALVKSIKHILYLQKQIQYSQMQLSLCQDFYPRLFFESYELDKLSKIIPSTMKHHLSFLNLHFSLSDIYHLFKKYAGEDGKLTYIQFQNIFTPVQRQYTLIPKNAKIHSLSQISAQTKKLYLKVLSTIILHEKSIYEIKTSLYERKYFDIKNIFNCIDNDQDGCISILDLQVLIKKYASLELSKLDIELLAHRFGKLSADQMVCYSQFVLQLTPKSPVSLSKCKSCHLHKQH